MIDMKDFEKLNVSYIEPNSLLPDDDLAIRVETLVESNESFSDFQRFELLIQFLNHHSINFDEVFPYDEVYLSVRRCYIIRMSDITDAMALKLGWG